MAPAEPGHRRGGVARWRRGTEPKHGALVAFDVLLAIMMPLCAVLVWLSDLGLWLAVPATIAGLGAVATAIHEVHLLRRAAR